MRAQLALVLTLCGLAAVFALLNRELMAGNAALNVFGWPYEGRLLPTLLIITVGSWIAVVLAGIPGEWIWRRRVATLQRELAQRGEEILQVKAAAYDRQRHTVESRFTHPAQPAGDHQLVAAGTPGGTSSRNQ